MDGLQDSEELYYYRKVQGENSLSGWECPGPYQKADNDVDIKVYSELWPAWADFHDIDKYWELSDSPYRALDPTNPDTDGDGVWDGVEITDDSTIPGRVDRGGHQLGYWPDEVNDYNYDESSNPLDGDST